jgi:hypothetical protein
MYGVVIVILQLGDLDPKLQIYKELIACPNKEEFKRIIDEGDKVNDYKNVYDLEPNIYVRMYNQI